MINMTKEWCELKTDETSGLHYIVKVMEEQTKNHKSIDSEITTTLMPGINKLCPVNSFLTYINALSPKANKLWQTPKFNDLPEDPTKTVWFHSAMGHNKLESFISDLVYACGIEKGTYSNHSLTHCNHQSQEGQFY